jgi:hypothetical protein
MDRSPTRVELVSDAVDRATGRHPVNICNTRRSGSSVRMLPLEPAGVFRPHNFLVPTMPDLDL